MYFQFHPRRFPEDCSEKQFRERYRVPIAVVDQLEAKFLAQLQPPTKRNQSLSCRDQIKVFLHFLGCNGFYHDVAFSHGISTDAVFRIVHKVANAILTLREETINWPANCADLPGQFRAMAGFPAVAGCLDGTHVTVSPPKDDEEGFVNRHHQHSLNVLGVCGPNLKFYYVNSSAPGRWHDSRVCFM